MYIYIYIHSYHVLYVYIDIYDIHIYRQTPCNRLCPRFPVSGAMTSVPPPNCWAPRLIQCNPPDVCSICDLCFFFIHFGSTLYITWFFQVSRKQISKTTRGLKRTHSEPSRWVWNKHAWYFSEMTCEWPPHLQNGTCLATEWKNTIKYIL